MKAIQRPQRPQRPKEETKTYPGTVYTSRAKYNEGIWWRREYEIKFQINGVNFECPISRLEDFVQDEKFGDDFLDSEPGNFSHTVLLTRSQVIPLLKSIASIYYYKNSNLAKEILAELLPRK